MSRIGMMPIKIPEGVKVEVVDHTVTVTGKKGALSQDIGLEVQADVEKNVCTLSRKNDSKRSKSLHGLYRNLVYNMVIGVSEGFQKTLLINGVGYRAELKDQILVLNLGFSNPIEYPIPQGITVTMEGNSRLVVSGFNKQQLGQVCAEIRSFRPPEPYKGKGIRYENEIVRRKVGKTGVT